MIYFTQSHSGKKQAFTPLKSEVLFYSCGPTVYDLIHVGNLRGALVADLIFRILKKVGFKVNYVRNYTDIDDKIIDRARLLGISASQLAQQMIQEVEKDFITFGLHDPTQKTLATEYISVMIHLIEKLIIKGHAYVSEKNDVLFSVKTFSQYGYLSGKKVDELIAGARVEVSEEKQKPEDFVLWKSAKSNEPFWESPWGPGRPGWHIECSAMILKCLGEQIDIHHGGHDLKFPHHENEIAQTESFTGKNPFAYYWLHHHFVTVNGQKMSKSLGNIITAREASQKVHPEVIRFALLSVHYRSIVDYNDQCLRDAFTAITRLYTAKLKLTRLSHLPDDGDTSYQQSIFSSAAHVTKKMLESFCDDLNVPEALGIFFGWIRHLNRTLINDKPLSKNTDIFKPFTLLQEILGIGGLDPEEGACLFKGELSEEEILKHLAQRQLYREQKNFAASDQIRDFLNARGVILLDDPEGTTWKYKI